MLAIWDPERGAAGTLRLDEYGGEPGFVIPSLIHYAPGGKILAGNQVVRAGLLASPQTFRWMKRYIGLRSPYSIQTALGKISAQQAAEDFLKLIEISASAQASFDPAEITLSVPLEAFEHYENWLTTLNMRGENRRIRIVDEAAAAAAGYGETVHPGDAFLLFDFGGSTLQAVAAVVQEASASDGEKAGRFCSIAGKSGCGIGGAVLDRWIYEEICRDHSLSPQDPAILGSSRGLLQNCEQLKLNLSEQETAVFDLKLADGRRLSAEYDRSFLERLFEQRGLFRIIREQIQETILQATDHGYPKDRLGKVIPVGGSCQIPAVHQSLANLLGEEKILPGEPMGAVARGAACFAGGMDVYDFIQHDYAVRYRDPKSGDYAFHPIIRKGTHYPTSGPVAAVKVKAACEGQTLLGLAIYEISRQTVLPADHYEILFAENGEVRLLPLTEQEHSAQSLHWMNEQAPAFLKASPPAQKGEARFETTFEIDPNKMLLLSATDLKTGDVLFSKFPVIRLA